MLRKYKFRTLLDQWDQLNSGWQIRVWWGTDLEQAFLCPPLSVGQRACTWLLLTSSDYLNTTTTVINLPQ